MQGTLGANFLSALSKLSCFVARVMQKKSKKKSYSDQHQEENTIDCTSYRLVLEFKDAC